MNESKFASKEITNFKRVSLEPQNADCRFLQNFFTYALSLVSLPPTPPPSLSLCCIIQLIPIFQNLTNSSGSSSNCYCFAIPVLIVMVFPSLDFLLYSLGKPLIISQSLHCIVNCLFMLTCPISLFTL